MSLCHHLGTKGRIEKMISEATVKALNKDGTVIVGCESTACNACHAQMFCNNKTQTQYPARNDNNLVLRVGDRVSLFLPPGKTILSTVLVFALPLILFPLGYFASGLLPVLLNEVQRALCGLGAMALAFVVAAVVSAYNRRALMPIVQSVVMRHLDVVGAAIMRDGKLFVAQCGSKKPEEPVKMQWFCPECGTKNEGKFCVECGTKKPV